MHDARIRGGGGAEGGSEERLDEVQEPKGMDVGKSSKRGRSRESGSRRRRRRRRMRRREGRVRVTIKIT